MKDTKREENLFFLNRFIEVIVYSSCFALVMIKKGGNERKRIFSNAPNTISR